MAEPPNGELVHGMYAYVERADGTSGIAFAQYRVHDFHPDLAEWVYLGTNWSDEPKAVRVVQHLKVVPA